MFDDVCSGGRDCMTDQFPGFVIGRSIAPSPLSPLTPVGGKQGFSCKLGKTAVHGVAHSG
jgi:hypothetical protein